MGGPEVRYPERVRSGISLLLAGTLVACADARATVPIQQGYGPNPTLPAPRESLLPTVHIAKAEPWREGEAPVAAVDLEVRAFATGLDHPRWLHVLPNGDVLVAESDASAEHNDTGFAPRTWAMKLIMGQAGSGRPSANRITLLRDADGDGAAEYSGVFLDGLNSPFGMTLSGGELYVADTDALLAFPYCDGETRITAPGEKIADLPAGGINHHWTKDVIASPDGCELYVTVGSNSNAAENGLGVETSRAGVLEVDLATHRIRQFASGLRNPTGLAWQPDNGALWVAVNERDELGGDLVPDYMTSLHAGGFYGWPTATTAATSIRASNRRGKTSSRRRSCQTTRSDRTPPRSASPSTRATPSGRAIAMARSSASIAPRTAFRAAATRSSSYSSPAGNRPGRPATC